MRIIGAAWGRTGTTSASAALERLGAGPVCHMSRMFEHPDEAAQWAAYRRGALADLAALTDRYGSGVDWPACWAWKDLAALHPEAPVLLTTRDPQQWYESVLGSVHLWSAPERMAPTPQVEAAGLPAAGCRDLLELLWDSEFGGWERVLDRGATVAAYEAHVADVRATCPPARLVEWSVADGWEPLCAALGVPVPDEPFPHLNSRAEGTPPGSGR
ncbi:MAG: sulfotransferase family protein [Actinomycetota bacterium]|nr:sulfotransferase family protein [Actinomycetota bacterium]